MNTTIFRSLMAVFLLCTAFTAASEWATFTNYEGKFRVRVPTLPDSPTEAVMREKVTARKTAVDTLYDHTFFLRLDEKDVQNVFYIVSYCDYPKGTFHTDSTELVKAFFDATIEGAVASVGGKLQYQSDILLNSYRGKLWRITYNGERAISKSKCYLVRDRFYMLTTIMKREKGLNPSADKFLDSFEVLE